MTSSDAPETLAYRLGFEADLVVRELGLADDADQGLRTSITSAIGADMVDTSYDEEVDAVVLWLREGDGDLLATLVDASAGLAPSSLVLVLTPTAGHPGYIERSDMFEISETASHSITNPTAIGTRWSAWRMVTPNVRSKTKR